MKVSFWKIGYALALIGGAAYGFVEWRGPHGSVARLMQTTQTARDLEQETIVLHREIEAQTQRIKRLTDNPEEQELEIRKRLKLVKSGEKSYILQDSQNSAQQK